MGNLKIGMKTIILGYFLKISHFTLLTYSIKSVALYLFQASGILGEAMPDGSLFKVNAFFYGLAGSGLLFLIIMRDKAEASANDETVKMSSNDWLVLLFRVLIGSVGAFLFSPIYLKYADGRLFMGEPADGELGAFIFAFAMGLIGEQLLKLKNLDWISSTLKGGIQSKIKKWINSDNG